MRWDHLFADLEAQADALDTAERAGEIAERTRIEIGRLGLADRLRAALGTAVRFRVPGTPLIGGVLQRVGPDWALVDEGGGREAVVALAAVRTVLGLGRQSDVPGGAGMVSDRLGMRSVLRAVARDRSPVRVHLDDGEVLDATIDRVGADFLELARHAPGEPRRRSEVRDVVLVPLPSISAVRRELS